MGTRCYVYFALLVIAASEVEGSEFCVITFRNGKFVANKPCNVPNRNAIIKDIEAKLLARKEVSRTPPPPASLATPTTDASQVTSTHFSESSETTVEITTFIASTTAVRDREVSGTDKPIIWYQASNGYFYKVFDDATNYTSARLRCQAKGAELASAGIRNTEIRGELLLLMKTKTDDIWIGANDLQTEGTFVWEDGVVSSGKDIDWYKSQPDNYGGREDCVHYRPTYNWQVNDDPCNKLKMYLCEKIN